MNFCVGNRRQSGGREGIREAIAQAKEFITAAIKEGLPLGKGHGPANPMAWLWQHLKR